jgi:hypothetical protein
MMVSDYRCEFDGQLVLRDATAALKPEASPAPGVIPTSNGCAALARFILPEERVRAER